MTTNKSHTIRIELPVLFEITYPANLAPGQLEQIKQRAIREVHLDLSSIGDPAYTIKTVRR